jgi:predicted PurR-regulated permease PerM
MGIAMGLIIGVLNLVPYMQALGIPPCILLCLVQSMQTGQPVWLTLLLMTIVFIVVQSLQDMVLTPKIMGKVTGLSPAAILLSLSIWGALMGVIGMIIALPLTTLLVSYYRYYVLKVSPEAEEIQAEVSTPTSRAITKAKTAINKLNKKRKRKSNP